MAKVRPVGANPDSVGKSAWRQMRAQTLIDDFDQWRDILDVVSRYAAADCKNPKTLGCCHQLDELFAVTFEIHENRFLAAAITVDVVDVEIIAQLGVHKGRYNHGHAEAISRFEYTPLVGIVLSEIFANKFIQQRRTDRA